MSLAAVLCFTTTNYKEHNLIDCKFQFTKHFNKRTHHPDTDAKCGVVELTIAPKSDDFIFYNWYIDREVLSGSITFDLPLSDSDKKVLVFENAYCVSIAENYNILDNKQRVLKLEFIAECMSVCISTKSTTEEVGNDPNTDTDKIITLAKLYL